MNAISGKTDIILQSVTCLSTSESGHDEVYIHYSIDGGREQRFPATGYVSMSPDGADRQWITNLPLSYSDNVVVSLYDSDTFGDEFLGSYTYYVSTPVQPCTQTLSKQPNGAQYQLSTVAA